ncbi:hypothetical protein ACA910_007587 [Epithemia clementina (nom. ined.)]
MYGTVDTGYSTMGQAWPNLEWKWDIGGNHGGSTGLDPRHLKTGVRYSMDTLNTNPVDLLVVERGHILQLPSRGSGKGVPPEPRWRVMIRGTEGGKQPKLILESWSGQAGLWPGGPTAKSEHVLWDAIGYSSRYRTLGATQVGGAILQERLLVARVKVEWAETWAWSELGPNAPSQPMSNLLDPQGLVPYQEWRTNLPAHVSHCADPLVEPMPWSPWQVKGGWIHVDRKGYRQILPYEIGRGLGILKPLVELIKKPSLQAHSKPIAAWKESWHITQDNKYFSLGVCVHFNCRPWTGAARTSWYHNRRVSGGGPAR